MQAKLHRSFHILVAFILSETIVKLVNLIFNLNKIFEILTHTQEHTIYIITISFNSTFKLGTAMICKCIFLIIEYCQFVNTLFNTNV